MEGKFDLKEVKDFIAVKASDSGTVTAVIENTKKKGITAITAVAVLARFKRKYFRFCRNRQSGKCDDNTELSLYVLWNVAEENCLY